MVRVQRHHFYRCYRSPLLRSSFPSCPDINPSRSGAIQIVKNISKRDLKKETLQRLFPRIYNTMSRSCYRTAKGSKWFILTVCRLPAWACWAARWRGWRTPTGYPESPRWVHDRPAVCLSGSATMWSSFPGKAGAAVCQLDCLDDIWSGWTETAGPAFPAPATPAPGLRSSDAREPPTTPPSRTRVRTLVVAASPVPESSQPGTTRATT